MEVLPHYCQVEIDVSILHDVGGHCLLLLAGVEVRASLHNLPLILLGKSSLHC